MTALAVDTSNLVADKNTSITSNQETSPQKSVGKKSRKKKTLPARSNTIMDKKVMNNL